MSEVNVILPEEHNLGPFNIKWSFDMEYKLFHDMYPIRITIPEHEWEIHVHYQHLPSLKELVIGTVQKGPEEEDEDESND